MIFKNKSLIKSKEQIEHGNSVTGWLLCGHADFKLKHSELCLSRENLLKNVQIVNEFKKWEEVRKTLSKHYHQDQNLVQKHSQKVKWVFPYGDRLTLTLLFPKITCI